MRCQILLLLAVLFQPYASGSPHESSGDRPFRRLENPDLNFEASDDPLVSYEAAQAFGSKLERAFHRGVDHVTHLIDFDRIIDSSLEGIIVPNPRRLVKLRSQLKEAAVSKGVLPLWLESVMKYGSSYKLLKVVPEGKGRWGVLMRFVGLGGAMNLIELPLVWSDGRVVANDFYVYSSLEPMSETFKRAALIQLGREHIRPQFAQSPQGKKAKLMFRWAPWIHAMEKEYAQGNWAAVEQHYQSIRDPEAKKMRYPQYLRTDAAVHTTASSLRNAVNDLRGSLPGDFGVEFMATFGALQQKNSEEGRRSLENLIRRIGPDDPFAQLGRACIADLQIGEIRKGHAKGSQSHYAREVIDFANLSLTSEPYLMDAYWLALRASLILSDRETGFKMIRGVSDAMKLDHIVDLSKLPSFKEEEDKLEPNEKRILKSWIAELSESQQ